ncbi:MAG: hypothetical protein Fur0042_17170 [Cyanophyceae cyanobacterium]
MDRLDRQSRIIEYLKIKPTHHGQLETCLLAIPDGTSLEFPPERLEEIRTSLTEQGTNLIPLMVRRSDAYGDEFEYEVIYGEEWCIVAQELGIDRLWVWMFDLDDQQAQVAREEMARLAGGEVVIVPNGGGAISPPPEPSLDSSITKRIDEQLQRIQQLSERFGQVEAALKTTPQRPELREIVTPQLDNLEGRFHQLEEMIRGLGDRGPNPQNVTRIDGQPLADVLNRALDAIAAGKIRVQITLSSPPATTKPIDKMTKAEVTEALKEEGVEFNPKDRVTVLREQLKAIRHEA